MISAYTSRFLRQLGFLPLAVALLGSTSVYAQVAFDLCATPSSVTMPDGAVIDTWEFADISSSSCDSSTATLPGPELRVVAGDTVTINLSNNLAVPTSILIPGQILTPSGGVPGQFTQEAAAGGGTVSYTFTAVEGTYLYESGTDPEIQVAMGLYGALIVESATLGQAYGQNFDAEAVVALGEIEPNLNADPGGFEFIAADGAQRYTPIYWLINGAAYPDTDTIPAWAGSTLLLRYLNPGFTHHAMALLGGHQQVIAKEAFALPFPFDAISETIPAGTTLDTIIQVSAGAGVGDLIPLFNRNMRLTNASDNTPGGMQTFIEIVPAADLGITLADTPDPVVVGNALTLSATVNNAGPDPATGVVATLTLPACAVPIMTSGCAEDPAGVPSCSLGSIASGGSAGFSVEMNIDGCADMIDSTVSVAATETDPVPDDNSASETTSVTGAAPVPVLYFSTAGNVAVPGVDPGTANAWDDADIYSFNSDGSFSRVFEARVAGGGADNLPGNADVDGLVVTSATDFHVSFRRNDSAGGTTVPGLGTVSDKAIVHFDGSAWTLYFDGTAAGLSGNGGDVDGFEILSPTELIVSTVGANQIGGLGPAQRDEDLLLCTHAGTLPITSCSWSLYFDGSDIGLNNGGSEDVDGVTLSGGDLYLSTNGAFDTGSLSGDGEDVLGCQAPTTGAVAACAGFTLFFDGSAEGLTENVDAIDLD